MNVVQWAEANWRLESGELIRLRPWQCGVLLAMFPPDGSASRYETFLISTCKKAGKTELNAVATLFGALTFPAPEQVYCVANDMEQAEQRVFDRIAKAVGRMGLVKSGAAVVSKSEITFCETGTKITAIPADFAGAAGAVFGITSYTELWGYRHEAHTRLWEELTPIPNRRSLRIVDSYAGFAGDAPVLEPLWNRALEGERLDDELPVYANGRLWAFIDQGDEAQQRAWLGDLEAMHAYYEEQRASLRPGTYRRLHENRWAEGEEAFIEAAQWDAIVDPDARPLLPDRRVRVTVGVDAAMKRDCSAVVAVTRREDGRLRVAAHRVWTPTKGRPLDFDETIGPYLEWLRESFAVDAVLYDPRMLEQPALTWAKEGLPMREFPQTPENLTRAGQGLFDLIRGRNVIAYPDDELRRHALNAVAVETARGLRLAKEKASKKIDALAALSFACVEAISAPRSFAGVAAVLVYRDGRYRERLDPADGFRDPREAGPHELDDVDDEATLLVMLEKLRKAKGVATECWYCQRKAGSTSSICSACVFNKRRRLDEWRKRQRPAA